MGRKKELQWGETPFHRMKHEELLMHALRMYSALCSADSVMKLASYGKSKTDLFWGNGSGGQGLEKAKQTLAAINKGYSDENIYRSFFRVAVDLLFEDTETIGLKTAWAVCDKCKSMLGGQMGELGMPRKSSVGEKCHWHKCDGILRPLTWEDLKIQNGK